MFTRCYFNHLSTPNYFAYEIMAMFSVVIVHKFYVVYSRAMLLLFKIQVLV